jgi:predicted glycosyltransferase
MFMGTYSTKKRVLLWVESVVGGGHLQVADQLATSLMQRGIETHVVTGSHYRSPEIAYGGATIHAYDKSLRVSHDAHLPEKMPEFQRPVLVSSGGGKTEDGLQLYETAILSKGLLPQNHYLKKRPWTIFVSHAYDDKVFNRVKDFAARNDADIIVRRNMEGNDFRRAVSNAALCVSLSGYNTVIEIYAADVPAVLLPFHNAAQGQLFRAKAFARSGKLAVLPHEDRKNPLKLLTLMDEVLAKRHHLPPPLKLRGELMLAETIDADLNAKHGFSPAPHPKARLTTLAV